jgi:amino acid adenylation domain-containing protein
VALLAILKAGGAYVPLDPSYPKERLAFMIQDTQAPVLLTQERCLDVLPLPETQEMQGVQVLCLDREWKWIAQEPAENLNCTTTAESLAYVMYTSGSTGKPKGVEILHRGINRLVFGVNYAQLDATQTILHMAPISFDASTFEVWGALLHGARCVLFSERIPTPKSIGKAIHKHNVTTAWLTATLFNTVIDEAPEALVGLKQLLTGGEALSVTHVRRALEKLPSTQLINGYGPHESTTFATCYPIPEQLSEGWRSIPIGYPISNTQVYILDRTLHPVPIGVPGELYIGGDGLARRYLNRPDLTEEKFVPHPFSNEPGARLYKTGDRVRYLPDGAIEFLGRLDHQIKLRGFRIELAEIESVLGDHPAVREVLVLARENERKEKRLVAYVVPRQGQHVTQSELRRFLKEQLPAYMVPSDFVMLAAIPMTPNGKVDQRTLPAPTIVKHKVEDGFVTPLLTVHHQLIQIWEDLLGVRPIGIKDNFFDLGGHSLLAARLVDKIEQVCGKKIPLATLFAGATIEHLADTILGEQTTRSRAPVVAVQAGGNRRPFFFLHGDWFGGGFYCLNLSRHLGPNQPFYVLEPYNFGGMPIPPTFEEMAKAHIESLRTVQPEGPYLLGGFCNGGLMAYEIARQLSAQGQTVDLLVMIDPASPAPHKVVRGTISRFGNLVRVGEEKQLDWFLFYIYSRISSYRIKVQDTLRSINVTQPGRARKDNSLAPLRLARIFPPSEALRHQWSGIYRWIAAGYMPGPYHGKLTHFWSTESFSRTVDWRKVTEAKEVTSFVFPGKHMSCQNENLYLLAERLSECLNEAQAN